MFYRISDIERVGADYARKLGKAGITTTEHLLSKTHDAGARAGLAAQTGIAEKHLIEWAAMADLMRVKGIGRQYSDLLLAVGVDSTAKLLATDPQELVRRMEKRQKARKLVGGVPKLAEVEGWQKELDTPAFAHAK